MARTIAASWGAGSEVHASTVNPRPVTDPILATSRNAPHESARAAAPPPPSPHPHPPNSQAAPTPAAWRRPDRAPRFCAAKRPSDALRARGCSSPRHAAPWAPHQPRPWTSCSPAPPCPPPPGACGPPFAAYRKLARSR
eukprot:3426748-Prymnesium_polylepis.1